MSRKTFYVCKRTKEKKIITSIAIKEEIYLKAVQKAKETYGVDRGAFSMLVEDLLEQFLAEHTQMHTRINPPRTIRERYNAVMKTLKIMKGIIPTKIPKKEFETAIKRTFEIKDERAVTGWLQTFYEMGFIKPLGIKILSKRSWKNVLAVEIVAKET